MTHASVHIQSAPQSVPTLPCWFAEVAIVAHCVTTSGLLTTIEQDVRFSRPRFGTYEVLDFVVVLLGYAISAEPTLLAFYDRVTPFAVPFMALFHREKLPHRATLSRFLAALDAPCVEALRVLFHEDLITQTAQTFPPGGLWDRLGHHWLVMDVDGTKQAARQRALPQISELPPAHRRFDQVCAPAYLGRKRLSPLARGKVTTWACGIIHALGIVNFLFDSAQMPHIATNQIWEFFESPFQYHASQIQADPRSVRHVSDRSRLVDSVHA